MSASGSRSPTQGRRPAKPPRRAPSERRPRAPDATLRSGLAALRDALRAVRDGDFSVRLPTDVDGHPLAEVIQAFNELTSRNAAWLGEVTRVSRTVGVEGDVTDHASLGGAQGAWSQQVDAVNALVGQLAWSTRATTDVLQSVARGDLSRNLTLARKGQPLQGQYLRMGETINTVIDQVRTITTEVDRVVREVGTEGKLGVQAEVRGVEGSWKDLTENVNRLAGNLTAQVRNIALVSTAIANGDLSQKITVEAKGEILELKNTINTMVDQLRTFAAEVTRVAREVGTEGQLGGQADVRGVSGTWRDLTDSVNRLASNLTTQVRNIALVTTAVANGDLSQKITVEAKGEILELKNTINLMVEQLRTFSAEVTRVAREVGTEGKLGAQAEVKGVSGTWRDLTDNVNLLAGNLTAQVRNIAAVSTAVANGDLSQKITVEAKGEILELKNTINAMVDRLQAFAAEVTRVATEVGTDGKLGGQADVKGVSGTWRDLTDSVNLMARNLTNQVRGIARVVTAVANGDLSQSLTLEVKGEIAELAVTINSMTDTLRTFADQVTNVAREVAIDGKLGGQARVPGVAGTWKDLTENVNLLAGNLTAQVRNIALVTTAVANGDLSQKITVDVQGEILELKNTINTMVDQLRNFAAEVTRVAREVGSEGKLGAQAEVVGVSGTWKDLTDSVNMFAGNLTAQVRNIAAVSTAVANGDLSQKITVEAKGEILELKNTLNAMVDRLQQFASEVSRVAREVGTEGRLGGLAEVKGVSGMWRDLTDNVNLMARNLTNQVRGIARVVTAVANGDLSQELALDAKGEIATLADTINNMTDVLRRFAEQVTTVAKEVGIEGKLGGQARVPGVAGTWRDLTDNVNLLAGNLTSQVRNIALVTTAVADGDLSQKITVEAQGEVLALKDTINVMVDRLRTFAAEVTRVAREVGTEGRLGGQAKVPDVAGTWAELTESVNMMASNLTNQVRGIAKVVTAVADGDLNQKLTLEARGEIASLADTINDMTSTLRTFADEVTTVARQVGTEGKLGGQARVPGAAGTWKGLTENVNLLAGNLTSQVRNIALVTTAVANGDLSKKITVEAQGEILELKNTVNEMTDRLTTFAAEVTRVAREVGTEGRLGGQAQVPGVAGTWKDLTDNVNLMASNLTDQVRGISQVVTSVANGDLSRKLMLVARGEIATLADTINNMTETLRTFAGQVTTVAREVGIEGRLGGQAQVPGAAGTWKDLTENVNQLAANLTTQVRSISEVAASVTQGDLTRSVTVAASGEVLELKDTINEMIANLRDTTRTNKEQDWLKTNLARFFGMMQGQRKLEALTQLIMSELTPVVGAQHGAFYMTDAETERSTARLVSTYAYTTRKRLSNHFGPGEGLVGQCLLEKKPIIVGEVPADYITITSGLGESAPRNIIVLPVLFEGKVMGVVELGSFTEFTPIHVNFLEQLMLNVGVVMNMIGASSRTEELLQQLQRSNVELETRRAELEDKARQLESKNVEIAEASESLEEKAKELDKVSRYKSQFLANMSHEIRTPLNSMLVLAQMLATNDHQGLTDTEVEYAETIHSAGRDLLALIDQILDLSKVEAGRLELRAERVTLVDLREQIERTFRGVALQKQLELVVDIAADAPEALVTDRQLLLQILKNLMANAFKFTDRGHVRLTMSLAVPGIRYRNESLLRAPRVLAFEVTDTGTGIPEDKQEIIFEAFQQADASITRQFGGTGLGLTISREYARTLGGEIQLRSTPGQGSTFILYLPLRTSLEAVAPLPRLESATEPTSSSEPTDHGTERPVEREADEAQEVHADVDLHGRTVLVVDDDARNLYVATAALEAAGMVVLTATSGTECLEVLEQTPEVDIVLMDIMMPGMSGYEATKRIRENDALAHIPIVALSAKASGVDRDMAAEAGLQDFLVKPVEIPDLLATLRRQLAA